MTTKIPESFLKNFYTGTTDPTSTTRLNADCYLYATRIYNAVYNDYAECFNNKELEYDKVIHKIVELDENDNTILASEDSTVVVGIVSNSYGHLLGGTEETIADNKKIPVGLIGQVYVDSIDKVDIKNRGKFITSGGNGLAKVNDNPKLGTIVGKIIGIDIINNRYKIVITLS